MFSIDIDTLTIGSIGKTNVLSIEAPTYILSLNITLDIFVITLVSCIVMFGVIVAYSYNLYT